MMAAMSKPIIHLCAPASPGQVVFETLGVRGARELIRLAQDAVGPAYRVRGRPSLIEATLDDNKGGRSDDAARVRELEEVMSNDEVAAMVAVRGGAWLTRILPQIDFHALDRRKKRLAVIGFSEITPLVNLVGAHRRGYGYYYMTPGFPPIGMARYGRLNISKIAPRKRMSPKEATRFAQRWAAKQATERFNGYFREVVELVEKRRPTRKLTGTLVSGNLPTSSRATVIGGCLTLVTPLAAGAFASRLNPRGKWIALEDLEETPYRIDRQLAHLKLAGWFERCTGVLIGDFHEGDEDHAKKVVALLKYHLPAKRRIPIVVSKQFGHIWPQVPLPIGRRLSIHSARAGQRHRVSFEIT